MDTAAGLGGSVGGTTHGAVDTGAGLGGDVGSTANAWSSLDVSNAFGSGLDSTAGAHDTGLFGDSHAGADLTGSAGADLTGDAMLH
ncbi:hypothetical protein ACIA8C_12060 [Nocardia sp. NPDC051321]|uniref:hypothetical protein n=1 Tax=Nocardia sp. NPDC051321 TaxID=3364323 RepID=UPI0037A639CB